MILIIELVLSSLVCFDRDFGAAQCASVRTDEVVHKATLGIHKGQTRQSLAVWLCGTYVVHHFNGTELCCAPSTCVVHHDAQGGPTFLAHLHAYARLLIYIALCLSVCLGLLCTT